MKLLPCPFCGGEAELEVGISGSQGGEKVAWVKCSVCGSRTEEQEEWNSDCEEDAIKKWNTRL